MFRKCRVQESGSLTGIEQQISPKEPNLILIGRLSLTWRCALGLLVLPRDDELSTPSRMGARLAGFGVPARRC